MSTQMDLDKLAFQIGAEGEEEDSTLKSLAKGSTDAIGIIKSLLGLRKGGPMPEDEEEEEEEEEEDEDAPPPEDEEGADGEDPSYSDMRMGDEAGVVDVTELVHAVHTQLRASNAALRKSHKQNAELVKLVKSVLENQGNHTALIGEAIGSSVLPLYKAVGETRQMLLETPAAAAAPRIGRRARQRVGLAAPSGGARDLDGLQLLKGMNAGLISESDLRQYKQHGQFCSDEQQNAELVASVKSA